jgi:predicted nucleotidyltransferase component of viral defense system
MYKSVLEKTTINNIGILTQQDFIKSFYLAGGTACAIHLGHRISNDLDFFSEEDFSPFIVKNSLQSNGHFLIDYSDSKGLIGRFNKTKISFFEYKYPLIRKTHPFINLNISSLEDVACMKIDAISSRGSKRDFVDLYFILKNFAPRLKNLVTLYPNKPDNSA